MNKLLKTILMLITFSFIFASCSTTSGRPISSIVTGIKNKKIKKDKNAKEAKSSNGGYRRILSRIERFGSFR